MRRDTFQKKKGVFHLKTVILFTIIDHTIISPGKKDIIVLNNEIKI